MHRIEINVCVESERERESAKAKKRANGTQIDNKNIYNFTLGAVMDFRVYF